MPRLIDPGAGDPIGLEDLIEAIENCGLDLRDEDALASLGPLLARLGRNRSFLGDLVIAELKARCAGQGVDNAYGAQVFMLKPSNGRYMLRANFWPAPGDAALRASGRAAFFYDLPHDHNFSFLTVGYQGPGYWSDYYEYDRGAVIGMPGEAAGLRFVERSQLTEGKVLLYRAGRDIHAQLPPEAMSVSLNILAYDRAQPWREQYRFDLATGTIAAGLTVAPSEALVAIAAHFGGEDVARDFAARHPVPRMRVTALVALASAMPLRTDRLALFEAAADDPDANVAGHARLRIAAIEQAARLSP